MIFSLFSITLLLVITYVYLRFKVRPKGWFLPDAYIVGIGMYTIGATTVTYGHDVVAGKDVVLMAYTTLSSALIGCIAFIALFGSSYKNISLDLRFKTLGYGRIEKFGVFIGLLSCVLVCFLFMYTISRNEVVINLLSFGSDAGGGLLAARKAMTSGSDGYFAPGFVKQFRDILGPIFLIALMLIDTNRPAAAKHRRIFYGVLSIIIVSMILSGIRSILVVLLLSLFVARSFIIKRSDEKKRKSTMIYFVLFILTCYGALTFFLGRAKEEGSVFEIVLGIIPNLFERVFIAAPEANILTYSFWGVVGPTNGLSWVEELASVMPGMKEFGWSNQLHSLTGGSEQGNAPLGMPADLWFAWGWKGILIGPLFYSIFLGFFDMLLMSKRSVVLISIKIYMMVSLLKIYSPFGFVLYGGAASVILMMLVLLIKLPSEDKKDLSPRYVFRKN